MKHRRRAVMANYSGLWCLSDNRTWSVAEIPGGAAVAGTHQLQQAPSHRCFYEYRPFAAGPKIRDFASLALLSVKGSSIGSDPVPSPAERCSGAPRTDSRKRGFQVASRMHKFPAGGAFSHDGGEKRTCGRETRAKERGKDRRATSNNPPHATKGCTSRVLRRTGGSTGAGGLVAPFCWLAAHALMGNASLAGMA